MAFEYIKTNIASAAELRVSFAMQVVGMMLNNITFVIVWWLFLGVFGSINGWGGMEVVALQGYFAMVFGFAFTFFCGAYELSSVIDNGVFDSVLLTPRNLYARILTLATRTSAIGDILFGLVLVFIYIFTSHQSLSSSLLLFSFLIPSVVILTNFILTGACISFFLPNSRELSRFIFEILVGPSMYPAGVYQGATRFFFLFVLPAIAMGGLQVETMHNSNPWNALIVWGLAILWTFIALWVLKKGLRRYESGNLTGARV